MTRVHRRRPNEAGYSLIEMMFTVGILGVLGSMAVISLAGSRPGALGDGAMRVVLSQMNTARELAITQRKNMRVTFTNGNTVSILREEVPGPTLTTLSALPMEGGLQITTVANLADTPDAFCLSIAAVCFPTATGTPPEVKFRPDGTFVNQDGAILNGTIFVALPNQVFVIGHSSNNVMSARAITIQGSTGRVRGYRFDGSGTAPGYWKPV
jgi:prepilin-type N-terminal cleavage/methylation domain-containing protein